MWKKHGRLFVVILVMALIVGTSGWVYAYANRSDIPEGIHLHDWHLGGLSFEQVESEWKNRMEAIREKEIMLVLPSDMADGKERSFTLGEVVTFKDDELKEALVSFYDPPDLWEKVQHRWEARKGIRYELDVEWDNIALEHLLRERWPELFAGEPVNAIRTITDQDLVEYQEDNSAYHVDVEALLKEVVDVTPNEIWKEPSFSFELPLREVRAEVRLEDLVDQGIERKIAEYSTKYSIKADGRTHNVESTALVLHDTLLQPDEIFSYRKLVQETEKKFGYKPAPVILDGELRPGIGGGVCQVSTTLYNAVLFADLELVERRNHSLPIGYAPLGRDATYSDWGIDFRFKNTTDKHLLIRTEMKNGTLTVKLFGTFPEDKKVEVVTETVSTIAPTTETRRDSSLAPGQSKVIREGKPGYQVNVYKKITEAGTEKKVLVSKDTYKAQPRVVAVGQ
ncbi:VanW family protein [Ammoniphilus sp. YIM 78166]|uniref:VanW family protein n=1 Tax=Ammoniphilus sp. YIM 78166 TaxID=1644106 RepID=UPI00106F2853|nr:VanW family protein [Ammoniphilus sp. YIM 78166]